MKQTIIALGGNYGYINQLSTTIKSIVYHTPHVKIYLINPDIPKEWFFNVNHYLQAAGSEVVDKKISATTFAGERTPRPHINYMAFANLLIPELIPEDQVLFIDGDAIANADLTPLFRTQLGDHFIAAAPDIFEDHFNSGVILFNNAKLHQEDNVSQKWLDWGRSKQLSNADQSILNHFYGQSFLPLDYRYNYMIGYDQVVFYFPNAPQYNQIIDDVKKPVIIHYASNDKPWKTTSGGRLRAKWWQFHNLNWYEAVNHQPLLQSVAPFSYRCFTFACSSNLEAMESLLKKLPDVEFCVATWTGVNSSLIRLIEYPNFNLIPAISGPLLNEVISSSNAYVDNNDGNKEHQFMQTFIDRHQPILSLKNVQASFDQLDQYDQHYVFEQPADMIHKIADLVHQKEES